MKSNWKHLEGGVVFHQVNTAELTQSSRQESLGGKKTFFFYKSLKLKNVKVFGGGAGKLQVCSQRAVQAVENYSGAKVAAF